MSDPWNGKGIYNGDLLMYVDGYIKYVYSSYSSLTARDSSYVTDMKFNLHSAMITQIYNGLNHISHLLIMTETEKSASIQTNVKKYLKTARNSDNDVYCDILEYYVNSFNFLLMKEIRNNLSHSYSFPLHPYDLQIAVVNIAYIALQFIFYLKLVRDGDEWLGRKDKIKSKNEAREALEFEKENEKDIEKQICKMLNK